MTVTIEPDGRIRVDRYKAGEVLVVDGAISTAYLSDRYRGKGLYRHVLLALGSGLRSGLHRNAAAEAAWAHLERDGLAVRDGDRYRLI